LTINTCDSDAVNTVRSCAVLCQDLLVRSKAQESDETYYLWAMRFFMEFNRRVDFRVALIRCSLHTQTHSLVGL